MFNARLIISLCGAFILVVSTTILYGHSIAATTLNTWGGRVQMAIPTAVLFQVTGVGLLTIGFTNRLWTKTR